MELELHVSFVPICIGIYDLLNKWSISFLISYEKELLVYFELITPAYLFVNLYPKALRLSTSTVIPFAAAAYLIVNVSFPNSVKQCMQCKLSAPAWTTNQNKNVALSAFSASTAHIKLR